MAKRARERARQERQAAKRERREAASTAAADDPNDAPDESALMEEFRVLSEQHAAGLVSDDDHAEERHRIFVALGIESDESD